MNSANGEYVWQETDRPGVYVDPSVSETETFWKAKTIACKCPGCNFCRLFVSGERAGTCFYGGPFSGYLELREKPVDTGGEK